MSSNGSPLLALSRLGKKGGEETKSMPAPTPLPAAQIPELAKNQQPQSPAASSLNAYHGVQGGQGAGPADPMLAALARFVPAGMSPGRFNIQPLQGRGFQ